MTNEASKGSAARGQIYSLLAMFFRKPLDAPKLERLRAPKMLAAMKAAGINLDEEFINLDVNELCEILSVDFTHLFHGPKNKIMPYECIMIGEGTDLRGAATQRVQEFMANVGYSVASESGEQPDHVSVELAFMADLAMREYEAVESEDQVLATRSREIQDRFLEEHLSQWANLFAAKVKDRAQTKFYASIDDFTANLVALDRKKDAA